MKAIEQKKNENKENGPIKTKYRFSHRGLDCYILTSGWVEKRGQTEMTVDKTHVGVCEDLDFETPKLKSFAEAKKQVIKHIDEGKKDIGMNSLSKKKLAVIKSNAAPEVKLRAIEKLNENAIKSNDAKQDVVRLAQQLVKMCDEVKQNIKSLEAEAKRPADDDFVAKDILEELKDIQAHLKQAKAYRY